MGICEGAKEDKSGWSAFLRHLVDRGLKGVQLIISDAYRGLVETAAEYLPEASWQRCVVHSTQSRDTAEKKANAIIADLRAVNMSKGAAIDGYLRTAAESGTPSVESSFGK